MILIFSIFFKNQFTVLEFLEVSVILKLLIYYYNMHSYFNLAFLFLFYF